MVHSIAATKFLIGANSELRNLIFRLSRIDFVFALSSTFFFNFDLNSNQMLNFQDQKSNVFE